jgi:predicted metal-dependent HD superfamily phosphohydrolase
MVTQHAFQAETNDEKLIVDIGLSILGSPANVYEQFETYIRKEYKRVPAFIYMRKRKEIL